MSRSTKSEFRHEFGRRRLSVKTLNKNKLTLFERDGSRVSFREEMISDPLKDIIKAIIRGQIHDVENAVELLDGIDRKILFAALNDAQIETSWEQDHDGDKNKLIHRFNVLKDEILLGNHGSETLQEFKTVIDECLEKKMLTKTDHSKMEKLILSTLK